MVAKKRPQQVRIIAGEWRGRKLPVVSADGLRPTMDRVRETVFNWLMTDIQGAAVADLFAGTGAMGIEALSRGAKSALFVESNQQAFKQLENNLSRLGGADIRATVTRGDTLKMLAVQSAQRFDVVFLDPPFDAGVLAEVCQLLKNNHWLSPSALVYLEWRATDEKPDTPEGWSELRSGSAGDSAYALYQSG
jgi:16S rRNA (guanine966-N2)-methyltransferase